MALFNNLPTPMPWYNRIEKQDRFRKNVFYDPKICQLAPYDGILPFEFFKRATSELPQSWVIKCVNPTLRIQDYMAGAEDDTICDLSDFIVDSLIYGSSAEGGDYFIFQYNNNTSDLITTSLADGLPPGLYYMQMNFVEGIIEGVGHYCSELFRVPDNRFGWNNSTDNDYIELRWYHNSDLKPIKYLGDHSFFNILFLDTFITASEPEIEIEGEKDGYNELIPTFQKTITKYRLSMVVPDFIKQSLYVMQMHDNKFITTERRINTGRIKNPEVSATLSSDGALSFVELLFEQDVLVTSTQCENELAPPVPFTTASGGTLVTTFCNDSGGVTAHMATFPLFVYGELWGKVGAGPFGFLEGPISRADILATWSGNIGGGTGITKFKIIMRTFDFTTGESAESTPSPSC